MGSRPHPVDLKWVERLSWPGKGREGEAEAGQRTHSEAKAEELPRPAWHRQVTDGQPGWSTCVQDRAWLLLRKALSLLGPPAPAPAAPPQGGFWAHLRSECLSLLLKELVSGEHLRTWGSVTIFPFLIITK